LPVSVTSLIPDGPPIRLHLRTADHQIVHCDGPERIETGWWRHAPIRRDYYRIDLDSGARHWLFRSLEDGRWFLHGDYCQVSGDRPRASGRWQPC
jgi:protein ImuB